MLTLHHGSILDDGHLLSSSLTGFHCRWWRLRQQQSSDGRFLNLLWRVQPNEAPSRAALAQIPKETCKRFCFCLFFLGDVVHVE